MKKGHKCELVVTHPVSKKSLCGGSGARFCPPFIGQGYKKKKKANKLIICQREKVAMNSKTSISEIIIRTASEVEIVLITTIRK